MAEFEINLIRDRVLPKPFRKGLFWGILAYLGLCSAGLSVVVHRAALRMVDATEQRREMKVIQDQFRANHADEKDVLAFAQGLRRRMGVSADVLAGIDACLRDSVSLPSVLLGLAEPLPEESVLVNLDMDLKKGTIQFSVMAPTHKRHAVTAGQIIDLWNKEGMLDPHLKEIRAETSQRQYRSGRPVIVHRFSASFAKGLGGA
jgi:hypothetical protein